MAGSIAGKSEVKPRGKKRVSRTKKDSGKGTFKGKYETPAGQLLLKIKESINEDWEVIGNMINAKAAEVQIPEWTEGSGEGKTFTSPQRVYQWCYGLRSMPRRLTRVVFAMAFDLESRMDGDAKAAMRSDISNAFVRTVEMEFGFDEAMIRNMLG